MRDKVEPCQSANAELTYAICRFDIPTFTSSQLNAGSLAIPRLPARSITRDAVNELKLRPTVLDGEIVVLDRDGVPSFQLLQQWQKRTTDKGEIDFSLFRLHNFEHDYIMEVLSPEENVSDCWKSDLRQLVGLGLNRFRDKPKLFRCLDQT